MSRGVHPAATLAAQDVSIDPYLRPMQNACLLGKNRISQHESSTSERRKTEGTLHQSEAQPMPYNPLAPLRFIVLAALLSIALTNDTDAQTTPARHAPEHFGNLSVARMAALANYDYVDRLKAGMSGYQMITVTHGWVHEAAFTANGSPSGIQASDNWRMQSSNTPGIAFVLYHDREWIVSAKGALAPKGSAVGAERHITTPRSAAQDFIDDLYNGAVPRQLRTLGPCTVAGTSGVLYGVWRPTAHTMAAKACIGNGGGPILSYHWNGGLYNGNDWQLTQVGRVPQQLPHE